VTSPVHRISVDCDPGECGAARESDTKTLRDASLQGRLAAHAVDKLAELGR